MGPCVGSVPHRCRRTDVPDGELPWPRPSVLSERALLAGRHRLDRCAADIFIRELPDVSGVRPLPRRLLDHFENQLAVLRSVNATIALAAAWPVDRPSPAGSDGPPPTARLKTSTSPDTYARLGHLLDALRLGLAPDYEPHAAASLAYHIGLHAAYIWQEARSSDALFLTIGWLGLLLRRGGAWMPAAVARYLSDAVVLDPSGRCHVEDAMLDFAMENGELGRVIADAARYRLQVDEAFVRWPHPGRIPLESNW